MTKMETKNRPTAETDAPVEALCEVLDYLWADELRHYREQPTETHIFCELARVANWLNGGDWDAADYATAWGVMPEMGWRVAGIANKAVPPESLQPAAPDEPEAEWAWEGYGSRYRVQGRKPSIRVIVGWDRPLATYFAQVWDVPEGATHHEDGQLLLWRGTSHADVPHVENLAEVIAPFVTLPHRLAAELEADRHDEESCSRYAD